jgi:hypothetical protein
MTPEQSEAIDSSDYRLSIQVLDVRDGAGLPAAVVILKQNGEPMTMTSTDFDGNGILDLSKVNRDLGPIDIEIQSFGMRTMTIKGDLIELRGKHLKAELTMDNRRIVIGSVLGMVAPYYEPEEEPIKPRKWWQFWR